VKSQYFGEEDDPDKTLVKRLERKNASISNF